MVVMVLENVPVGLRGELTRWLLELKTGVFVGKVSGLVRDKLWEKVCADSRGGGALLVHNADTEQGFAFRFWGFPSRGTVEFEGLSLVRIPDRSRRAVKKYSRYLRPL